MYEYTCQPEPTYAYLFRFNLLCSELKQLYVLLTRARQRLWIYDEEEGMRRRSALQVSSIDLSIETEAEGGI